MEMAQPACAKASAGKTSGAFAPRERDRTPGEGRFFMPRRSTNMTMRRELGVPHTRQTKTEPGGDT
jgi:hypothetical protein